jgi:hypothetical protein
VTMLVAIVIVNGALGFFPLAVAARGAQGVIRTPNGGLGIRSPHHRQPGRMVRPAGFEPALVSVWCRSESEIVVPRFTPNQPKTNELDEADWSF